MKNRRNFYRILHVQPDAPADIIKSSYRTLMQKLKMHPDLGGDEWNASVLNEAYQVLSDPGKRAAYDATFISGQDGLKSAATQTTRRRSDSADQEEPQSQTGHTPIDPSKCAFCSHPKPAPGYVEQHFCNNCSGPLSVASILRPAGTTERACNRMPQNAPLNLFLSVEDPGRIARLRDLSPAGLRVQLWHPLENGSVVRIDSHAVAAIGRVVFCNRSATGNNFNAGIEFITVHFHTRSGTFVTEQA